MLTVLIDCGAEAAGLGATLAALVPGAVEGLVRDVIVVDRGMDAASREVADHAGCRIVPAFEFRAAIAGAKGEWLLLLEPGARPGSGWIDGVAEHLVDGETRRSARAARFSPARTGGWFSFGRLRRKRPLADGLLLPKARGVALAAKHDRLAALAKHVPTAQRLAATIRPSTSL